MMRLQKFLADAGVASRRKCEALIAAGLVSVNGKTATVGCSVDPERDTILYNGERLHAAAKHIVIALNKPAGIVCTANDPEGRKTVMDFFSGFPQRLYNVGRLDYDSEGLLLMTNDGELANRLMHPKYEIEKVYHVICNGLLTADEKKRLEDGLMLSEGITAPAKVENLRRLKNGNSTFDICIHEGRNRQVRRMLASIGHNTLLLRRIRIDGVRLGNLAPGNWRYLREDELESLKKTLSLPAESSANFN